MSDTTEQPAYDAIIEHVQAHDEPDIMFRVRSAHANCAIMRREFERTQNAGALWALERSSFVALGEEDVRKLVVFINTLEAENERLLSRG